MRGGWGLPTREAGRRIEHWVQEAGLLGQTGPTFKLTKDWVLEFDSPCDSSAKTMEIGTD